MASLTSSTSVYLLVAMASVVLSFSLPVQASRSPVVDPNRFVYLSETNVSMAKTHCSQKGYATDTIEQVMEAVVSPDSGVRHAALTLLTSRVDKEAIPVLKNALADRDMIVRIRAADLLGRLGDGSCLPVLQRDYESFLPHRAGMDPNKGDPNVPPLTKYRLYQALRLAQMLAKFGDNRGFELAAKTVLQGEAPNRVEALYALFEMNVWTERATLLAEKTDPVPIFLAVADSEKDAYVLTEFVNRTVSHTRGDLRRTLLEKIAKSEHASDKVREKARMFRERRDLESQRAKEMKDRPSREKD